MTACKPVCKEVPKDVESEDHGMGGANNIVLLDERGTTDIKRSVNFLGDVVIPKKGAIQIVFHHRENGKGIEIELNGKSYKHYTDKFDGNHIFLNESQNKVKARIESQKPSEDGFFYPFIYEESRV